MTIRLVMIIGTLFFSVRSFAMGGDKPGPNGGHITMPGTYHVELVDKGNIMQVYLLDIAMKNPVVENSSVTISYLGIATQKVNCQPVKKYFNCEKPKGDFSAYKTLNLESVRNKIKGKAALYKLPLRFEK